MDKYLGKRLDGRYEIHELIGIGGMANVYRCTDTVDDREVAIKILKDEFLNNDEFIRRFKNESKAIAMLSHPNIVKVYDVSFGDMIQYIVMEYIDGITLKEFIERQGVIEWKDALHLITQVLRALQHAHESGIVHRDIKPQNIMLLQDGTIKVTDFGIARFSDKATRTMTDQAIGSVHYIAPEQARGDVTDGKTDIYSVGVMLYEMLTGKLPFEGDSAVTVALMQLQSTPTPPRDVNPTIPEGLEQITMRAMEKQPEDRYTSAAEMLSDIERFRMNPSIVFDYVIPFVDEAPTKFVESTEEPEPDASYNLDEFEEKTEEEAAVAAAAAATEPEATPAEDKKEKKEKEKAAKKAARVKKETKKASRYAADKKQKPKKEKPAKKDAAEDDDDYKERGNGYYAVKGILIAAVAMCLIFGILAMIMAFAANRAEDVYMPNFVGRMLADVKADNPENFQFEIKSRFDNSLPLGTVLAQEPADSMIVKSGSIVTLTVNSNEEEIGVPFFNSSMKRDQAVTKLQEIGLVPEVVAVADNGTKDAIIGTFPAAGAKAPVGSTVYLYVSSGADADVVEIPAVIGLNVEDARAALEDAGFEVETVQDNDSSEKKDTVVVCSPLPHAKVERGATIMLTVSSGVGDKSRVTLNIEMPGGGVAKDVQMGVTIDDEVNENLSKTVPAYTKAVQLQLEGAGTKKVSITLDQLLYREYSIDFNKGTVNVTIHEIQLSTEPVTYAVEGGAEEYTEPVDYYDESALIYS